MNDESNYLNETKIIIFGTGTIAKDVTEQLGEEVFLYLDNDSEKWLKKFHNKEIHSPEILAKEELSGVIILVASMYYKEISEQLINFGLKENNDFFNAKLLFIENYKDENTWSNEYYFFEDKINALIKHSIKSLLKNYLKNYKNLNSFDSRIALFESEEIIGDFSEKELYDFYIFQLNKMRKVNKSTTLNKVKNIHFLPDNMHSKEFYDYIQKSNYTDSNLFVLTERNNGFHFFDNYTKNIYKITYNSLTKYSLDLKLIELINHSEAIFIHSLTDEICELFENPILEDVKKYWIVWGADLYSYINIPLYEEKTEEVFINSIIKYQVQNTSYRKNFIKNINGILTWIKGDFDLVKQNYKTNAIHKHFLYPSCVNFSILDNILLEVVSPREKINVLVGNSGTQTNNHLEVFEKLVDYLDEIDKVIVPLSYGDKIYIEQISILGKKLLGAKFHPLYDFLESYDYGKIINNSDLILMNHKRQQGVGNIITSLYLGKTVYLSKSVTTFNTFKDWGFSVKNIENFFNNKKRNLDDFVENKLEVRKINQQIINSKYFKEIDYIYAELFK